jgi:hypothetical protein
MCTIFLFTDGLVIGFTTTFNLWQLPEHLALALARYDAGTRTRGVNTTALRCEPTSFLSSLFRPRWDRGEGV